MNSLAIRHLLPPLGALPTDPAADGVSGLVGACLGIAVAQAANGHHVEVFGWRPSGSRRQRLAGVEVRSTAGWPWARLAGLDFRVVGPVIAMASSAPSVDVMHAFSEPHLLLARGARARVLHYETPIPARSPRSHQALVAQADAIVFCSEYLRDRFHRSVEFPAERTFVVHNGIHLEHFRDLRGDVARRRWGIPAGDIVLVYAGAVVPEKGLHDLVAALARVSDRQRAHLVVAGGSGLWQLPGDAPAGRSRYEVDVHGATGRLPRVTWLGVVPAAEMPAVFAAADLCVCPSRWAEPFGTVTVEAMAAGRAVVAARVGGIPEAVEDGVTGILYPPGDRDALTAALRRLLEDGDLRAQMGRAGRHRAERFGWDSAAQRLDAVYEQALRRGSALETARPEPARRRWC
jgi:glycosyltransferase involved in cell wall biosynthesis